MSSIRTIPMIRVNNYGGRLVSQSPVVLGYVKEPTEGVTNLLDISDIEATNLIDGAVLVYNASSELYEIRPLEDTDIPNDITVDGGSF